MLITCRKYQNIEIFKMLHFRLKLLLFFSRHLTRYPYSVPNPLCDPHPDPDPNLRSPLPSPLSLILTLTLPLCSTPDFF